jgi:general secretion pathway protein K
MNAPSANRRAATGGFIFVTVLWILLALAGLVSVYAVYVSNSAMAAAARDDDLVTGGLVTAGVELAAYRFVSVPKDKRPGHGEVAFRMGKARILAAFRNEAARIDLNAASRELLAGLFVTLGAREEEAGQYADRILAWRTQASGGQDAEDAEAALYRDAGLDYGPRGAPFVHVEELWLVADLPPALVERALPHVTVFNGRPEILVEEADPVVRAAMAGPSPGGAADGLSIGGPADTAQGAAPPGTTLEGSDAVRVTVRVDFDNGRTRAAEAVILLRDFGEDPYRVLSWRDDVEPPAPPSKMRTEPKR